MEESLEIHDISEPCQIWTGIWMSLGRGVQLLALTSFGRSNHCRLRNFYIYHLSKFRLDPTVQTLGTFRLVRHFLDLFSTRKRIRPEFIFFMNRISDIPFEGSFVWGIVFCSRTHPTNFKIFWTWSSTSCWCQTSPAILLYGCRPGLDTSSL